MLSAETAVSLLFSKIPHNELKGISFFFFENVEKGKDAPKRIAALEVTVFY